MRKKTSKDQPAVDNPKDAKSALHKTFPIVGVGVPAGGLDAFCRLLKSLPIDTGMAFVLVQHLDPEHVSLLPDFLKRTTLMRVVEVTDGVTVEANSVYVMPPNHNLAILHGVLHLMSRADAQGKHLPIDDFFRTLAEDCESNAIAVILSGTDADGTSGLQAIKENSGITFAQSEDTAEFNGLPLSAIAAGHVDYVLSPEEIAKELARIAKHPGLLQDMLSVHEEIITAGSDILNKIFVLLRSRSGNDFTHYKHTTIRRRIKRRMVLQQIERMEDYVKYLQQQPGEVDALFQDILINVTSFFRDPETFEGLKTEVFPHFIESGNSEQVIRIWIPGCSTGEEVYSVAIALLEFLGERSVGRRIQIFASDIDDKALERARQGIYPEAIRDDVTPARLQRFFHKTSNGYQISKTIRDMCVFALQNVIQDPPFSRLDLICCRNLMIYLGTVLQKKVLQTFHYALHPGSYLMLGTSETIGSSADLYSLVDKKNKIYLKKSVAHRQGYDFSATPNIPPGYDGEHTLGGHPSAVFNLQHEAENLKLSNFNPPGIIINKVSQLAQELEQELLSTREYMQSIIGGQDTNNEKLQSANETLVTIDEEHETQNQELNLANIDPIGNIHPIITEKEIV